MFSLLCHSGCDVIWHHQCWQFVKVKDINHHCASSLLIIHVVIRNPHIFSRHLALGVFVVVFNILNLRICHRDLSSIFLFFFKFILWKVLNLWRVVFCLLLDVKVIVYTFVIMQVGTTVSRISFQESLCVCFLFSLC